MVKLLALVVSLLALVVSAVMLHTGMQSLWGWIAQTEHTGGVLAPIVSAEAHGIAAPVVGTVLGFAAHGGPIAEHFARYLMGGS